MIGATRLHVRHHGRFYAAAVLGIVVWAVSWKLAPALRFVLAGDIFFGAYLVLTAMVAVAATPDDIRDKAGYEDEGNFVIVLLTLAAIAVCIGAIFSLIGGDGFFALPLALSAASVVLGWLTLHTIAAFRYAHLYYTSDAPPGAARVDRAGLDFPGTDEPAIWDFLYHAFIIGMTCQTSDVAVQATAMRRVVLAHAAMSFLFNTVLLALAVNIGAGQFR